MIKDVLIESIAKKREFRNSTLLSKKEVVAAIELAIQQLVINCEYFGESFPTPATFDNHYPKMDNTEWTNGFWTGALWLGHEYSLNNEMKALAKKNTTSFLERVKQRIELDQS